LKSRIHKSLLRGCLTIRKYIKKIRIVSPGVDVKRDPFNRKDYLKNKYKMDNILKNPKFHHSNIPLSGYPERPSILDVGAAFQPRSRISQLGSRSHMELIRLNLDLLDKQIPLFQYQLITHV